MRYRTLPLMVMLVLLGACSDDSSPSNNDTGVQEDGGMDGMAVEDGGVQDTSPEPECLDLVQTDLTRTPIPETLATQIHADVAFDGQGVWMVFNVVDANSRLFHVYATRLACDGTTLVEPMRIDEPPDLNKTDPAVAISDQRVLFAWMTDSSCCDDNPNNLDIHYRLYDLQGMPLHNDRTLESTRMGNAEPGNAWLPIPVGLPGGPFALVGSWAHQDTNRFQIFAQRLDRDGELVGDAVDAALEPERSQLYPSAAAADDGTLHMA
ncbi:MAG: hypothetical protein AAFX99_27685, partial [Myxococcota bacterium]